MASAGGSGFEFSGEGYEGLDMGEIMGEEDDFIYGNAGEDVGFQRMGMSGSDSSSTTSSSSNGPSASLVRTETGEPAAEHRRRTVSSVSCGSPENGKCPASSKKAKTVSGGHLKVKKEKLGERVTALQQLVSPFGKTDTASVLHEAMGYIKFLHNQVQVLSSPYMQRTPTTQHQEGGREGGEELRNELRSRGLCLVPVECSLRVASSNGADLWAPAIARNSRNSSSV
ncbi:transcription factor bHLH113-like [Nymphaea colorata]|nr:transcription factor bHLH113-like [Nymphaea colorata]